MTSNNVFDTDKFIKKSTIIAICVICFLGSAFIVYTKIGKKQYDGFTGILSIMEDDEASILRQIGIMDPLVSKKQIMPKTVNEDTMIKAAIDDIIGLNDYDEVVIATSTLHSKIMLMFNKDVDNLPAEIVYNGFECLNDDNMFYCTRVAPSDEIGHYLFTSDVFTMNGKNITFYTTILYYKLGDKYYTDSKMNTLICEGDVSCVYESELFNPRDVVANYYINNGEFLLKEVTIS